MLIDIDKIIVSNRIRKDFGNIEELAEDIKENTLLNPITVTPADNGKYILIAGERRLRACKLLGYKAITVNSIGVKDALQQLKIEISENECRKEFTFSEKMAWAKLLEEEYKKKAKENMSAGGKGCKNLQTLNTRDQIAKEIEFGSGETYRQAKFIAEHASPELIKELDEGTISINKAYQQLKQKLADAEQRISNLAKQLEATTDENQRLRELTSKPVIEEKIIEKTPDDYYTIKKELEEKNEKIMNFTKAAVKATNYQTARESINYLLRDFGKHIVQVEYDVRTALLDGNEIIKDVDNLIDVLDNYIIKLENLKRGECVINAQPTTIESI